MRNRGSVLIAVMLLAAVFFVMGGAMLLGNSSGYRAATLYAASAQARQYALSGLEDARLKLSKDQNFPPPGAVDQTVFGYAEPQYDAAGRVVGRYEVTVDSSRKAAPFEIIVIETVGTSIDNGEILARRKMVAEIDVAVAERGSTGPNPTLFDIVNFRDEGSLNPHL